MTNAKKPLLNVIKAAIVGGVIGALLVHRISPAVRSQLQFPVGMRLSIVLWLIFSIYWSIAAKDKAPTKTSESVWSRQLHLIWVNAAFLLLLFPVPGMRRRFLPGGQVLVAAGLLIQAACILLAIWGRRHLGSNWSGEVRVATEHQLVRSGPYRLIRHPIYTALLGMYCGTALVSGEIHAPLALFVVALAYWRKLRLEERALSETFGGQYDAYRHETWALVPGLY